MSDELTAAGRLHRSGDADLDAELVRPVRLAVIQVNLEQVTGTTAEPDLLAVGNKREAEDRVDDVAGIAALMVRRIQPYK